MTNNLTPFPSKALPYAWIYIKNFRWQTGVAFVLVLLTALLSNLCDWFFAEIISSARHLNTQAGFAQGAKYIAYLLVCGGITVWLMRFRNIYGTKNLYTPMYTKIIADGYDYLLGHSYGYVINTQTGSFLQHIQQLSRIRFMLEGAINGIWRPVAEIVIKTIILLWIHPLLGGGFFLCTGMSMWRTAAESWLCILPPAEITVTSWPREASSFDRSMTCRSTPPMSSSGRISMIFNAAPSYLLLKRE